MNYKQMRERGYTCASHPLNQRDRIVVEEIWVSTIEICKRLDALNKHLVGVPYEEDENPNDVQCAHSPDGRCKYDFGTAEDPTCDHCGLTPEQRKSGE